MPARVPPTWASELPTVESVVKSTPAGKDPRETAIRRAASFVVLQDLIELFTGKGFFDLNGASRSAPEVARYADYVAASVIDHCRGQALDVVLAYSDLASFRKDVLARFLSPASQQAYWSVRTATTAAKAARKHDAAGAQAVQVAMLDQLPSMEAVKRDMVGASERDTAARTLAAFRWLSNKAGSLSGGRAKADEYDRAAVAIYAKHGDRCKDESGCDPVQDQKSRFAYCAMAYLESGRFESLLDDIYLPTNRQSAEVINAHEATGRRATEALAGFTPPSAACTTHGQFVMLLSAEGKLRPAPGSVADPEGRRLALIDGQNARRVDMNIFGVPLGVVLKLPLCSSIESGASKTCLTTNADGSSSIHWGDGTLPDWAQNSVATQIKEDVLVSVKIVIPSWPQRPLVTINGGIVDALADAAAQRGYEAEMKYGPARVAKAQKQLEAKYGPPRTPEEVQPFSSGNVVTHKTREPEWLLDGLHVKYDADLHEDTVLIELDSVFKARQESQRRQEEQEPRP